MYHIPYIECKEVVLLTHSHTFFWSSQMSASVIKTLPTTNKNIVHGTVFGRGKGAVHTIACPKCNSLAKVVYATNKRVDKVEIETAPLKRSRRGRCSVKSCRDGFVNVSYRGMTEITELQEKGCEMEDLIKLVAEAGDAMIKSMTNGTH